MNAGIVVAAAAVVDDDEDVAVDETVPLGNVLFVSNISRISDSIGVLPTRRAKKISLITCELTDFKAGKRSNNLPKRFK